MPRPTGSAVLPPERAGSPGSLIVSFAGSYLRELGGWIAVADLIRARILECQRRARRCLARRLEGEAAEIAVGHPAQMD